MWSHDKGELWGQSGLTRPPPANPYDELGEDYFTNRLDPDRETRCLIAKLEALGHTVTRDPAA